jgi:hypothetical protein
MSAMHPKPGSYPATRFARRCVLAFSAEAASRPCSVHAHKNAPLTPDTWSALLSAA